MPSVQEIAIMLSGTLILVFASFLLLLGSIIISMRFSSWRTLLMIAGATLSLVARMTLTVTGYLEMAGVVSNARYQQMSGLTYGIGTIGNLVFAASFLALSIYLFRHFTSMAKKDSVTL